jgi:nucleoside-diphosphate-sugar epimerase
LTGTVIVVGASGFVGRRLVARLIDRNYSVIAIVRRESAELQQSPLLTVFRAGELDEKFLERVSVYDQVRGIFNLAAYGVNPSDRDPALMQAVNVDMAAKLIHLAAKIGAVFIQTGSSAEYAATSIGSLVTEQAALESTKIYGASKAAGGIMSIATAHALNVPMRHMRLFNVYGPGEMSHRLIPTLRSCARGQTRVPLSDGFQQRDFIFVDDCVEGLLQAFVRLSERAITGAKAVNLCTGHAITVRDFAKKVAERIGLSADQLGFGDIPLRPDDVPFIVGDRALMEFDLAWRPRYSLDQGIAATLPHSTSDT